MADRAEIGVFGGSGFYSLLDDVREIKVDTPYGPPSDSFFLATVAGRSITFLPRHGRRHTIPPHKVPDRANVWAMRSLGVKAVISPCAAGSLQPHVKPGDFVVCDQFVDRTSGRDQTFYDGPIVTHVSSAAIYDLTLRQLAIETIRDHDIPVHEQGTVVVIQGPLSTKSIEVVLRRRLGGHQHDPVPGGVLSASSAWPSEHQPHHRLRRRGHRGTDAVDAVSVLEVFERNSARIREVVADLIGRFLADLAGSARSRRSDSLGGDGHAASVEDVRLLGRACR
jgi:5'-methylthioadenosine phosphorylase